MKVVIDTNVLRATINRKNFEFFIYEAFIQRKFEWVVSTEILAEYEEMLIEFYSIDTANFILGILQSATNVIYAEPSFRWNLIIDDWDDNKFSNLALNVNAKCLVTKDRHFKIFKKIVFPKLNVLTPEKFKIFLDEYS
jgi:uncharacterized protein